MRAVVCAASSSVLSAKIGSFIWRTCPLRKTRKEARAAVYAAFTSFLPESKRLPALDVCRGRQETRRELQSAPHLLRFCPLETPSGCLLPGADLSWKLVRTLMPARGCGRCLCCGKGPCASIVHMVAFTHVLVAARAHIARAIPTLSDKYFVLDTPTAAAFLSRRRWSTSGRPAWAWTTSTTTT
eukprot:1157737-Pelagomonas_calceolata.AAC.3